MGGPLNYLIRKRFWVGLRPPATKLIKKLRERFAGNRKIVLQFLCSFPLGGWRQRDRRPHNGNAQ